MFNSDIATYSSESRILRMRKESTRLRESPRCERVGRGGEGLEDWSVVVLPPVFVVAFEDVLGQDAAAAVAVAVLVLHLLLDIHQVLLRDVALQVLGQQFRRRLQVPLIVLRSRNTPRVSRCVVDHRPTVLDRPRTAPTGCSSSSSRRTRMCTSEFAGTGTGCRRPSSETAPATRPSHSHSHSFDFSLELAHFHP